MSFSIKPIGIYHVFSAFTILLCICANATLSAQNVSNDTRATALALPVGAAEACVSTDGNTALASPSEGEPPCAPTDPNGTRRDLWYSFEATSESVTLSIDVRAGSVGTVWLYAEDGAGETITCRQVSAWSATRIRFDALTIGETVLFQIAALDPFSFSAFDLCLFQTPACEPPQIVQVVTGQNWAQLAFLNGDGSSALSGGRAYRAVAGVAPFDPVRGTPDTTALSSRSPITLWGLQPGEFYRIWLQEQCSETDESIFVLPTQNFRQEAPGTPPNDSVTLGNRNDILSSVSAGCFGRPGTTRSATPEASMPNGCAGDADDDVWYSIRPQGPQYRFLLTPAPGIDTDLAFEILDENFNLIACVNNQPGGLTEQLDAYDLVANTTYFVRVYTAETGAEADFEVCAFRFDRPILQDTGCTDALAVTLDGTGQPGEFVDMLTSTGEIIASIENTQDLGAVRVSYYGARDSIRIYATDTFPIYYGRNNITIEPDRQPVDSITVRFYISEGDLIALAQVGAVQGIEPVVEAIPNRTSTGSGTGSGSSGGRRRGFIRIQPSMVDLTATRVPQTRCSADYLQAGFATNVVGIQEYDGGLAIDVRVPGFSEFFFSANNNPLSSEILSGLSPKPAIESSLEVFPNPTTERITVRIPEDLKPKSINSSASYQLFDMHGRLVQGYSLPLHAGEVRLDISGYPAGMYNLLLLTAGEIRAARIVVE